MYHYCIVRADIPFGNQAAQIIHAAGESSDRVPVGTYAVALHAEDEQHLIDLSFQLMHEGIKHHRVIEGDGPYEGELMAIGISPCEKKDVKKILSSLPLVKNV